MSLKHQDKPGMAWEPTFSDTLYITLLSLALMTTSRKDYSPGSENTVLLIPLPCCWPLDSLLLWLFLLITSEQDSASCTRKPTETDWTTRAWLMLYLSLLNSKLIPWLFGQDWEPTSLNCSCMPGSQSEFLLSSLRAGREKKACWNGRSDYLQIAIKIYYSTLTI